MRKLTAIWKQIATTFRDYDSRLAFAGLNEVQVNYTSFYTAAAGARGIVCVWWDNANYTGGGEKFALIDRNTLTWVYPDIVLAIMKNCSPGGAD